jgi:FG-GAP-like repeat
MRRTLAVSLALLLLASLAAADVTRGAFVAEGQEFPYVADLDGNGIDDLIHEQYVLLNQGSATFVKRDLGFVKDEYVVDTLDLNGDGKVDLMTKNHGGQPPVWGGIPEHSVRLQTGPLQFGDRIQVLPMSGDQNVLIGDLNDDGKDDLMLQKILFENRRDYAAQMTVLLSRGDGTFERKTPFLIPTHPQGERFSHRLLMGDLNRDGRSDVVIRTTHDMAFLISRGNGEFEVRSRHMPISFGTWETDLADVDRDGNLDLVMAGARRVRVMFGDGKAGFNRHTSLWLPQQHVPNVDPSYVHLNTSAPRDLAAGEFIAKGRTEILGATAEGDVFVVALEGQQLKEVAPRIRTEYIQPQVYVGSFRSPNSTDFVMTDNYIYGSPKQPKPGLFHAEPLHQATAVAAPATRVSRGRAVARPSLPGLKFSTEAKDCVEDTTVRELERDGLWASFRHGNDVFEAVLDESGNYQFRYVTSWAPHGVSGTLQPAPDGGWTGLSTMTSTPCGQQSVRVNVR